MRRVVFAILCVGVASVGFSQETAAARRCRRGQAAGYATRDATVMSMMGWGIGLAVGIATFCALVENSESTTSH